MAQFPRQLSPLELEALHTLLPQERIGYRTFREFVERAVVIGEGRWGQGDLVLSYSPGEIDRTAGMTPVVAYGEFELRSGKHITLSVHTPEDEQMEVQFAEDISTAGSDSILSSWTYSTWTPNLPDPGSSVFPRTVSLSNIEGNSRFVLAISTFHRTIWLYDVASGFNRLIPFTGFYEYLLRSTLMNAKEQTQSRLTLSTNGFFDHIADFSDRQLREALLHYNQENRKFDASEIVLGEVRQRSVFLKFVDKVFKRSHV